MMGTSVRRAGSIEGRAASRPRSPARAVLLAAVVVGLLVAGVTAVSYGPGGAAPSNTASDAGPDAGPDARGAGVAIEERQSVARRAGSATDRPNVVLITADDMALTDLRWMPWTRRLVGRSGVELTNFLSNHPICCPARAEILTGQYGHNNGVHDNDGSYGGYQALRDPADTVGAWMQRAGYRTAFVGKYLNGWEAAPRLEAGWTAFNPLLRGVYRYYDFTLYRDGYPKRMRGTHSNEVIGRFTRTYVKRFSRSGSPFFVWASPVAPHNRMSDSGWRPPAAVKRHRQLFSKLLPPSFDHPGFNERDVSDKPPYIARREPVPLRRARIDHRWRVRSLQSLDEQVRRIVRTLRATGELSDTYVFFTSDNGYMLGEHRMYGKNLPYEESLKVPLLVRGPGLDGGAVRAAQYGLVDLAPTFLAIADASPGNRLMDGRSMLGTLRTGGGGYRDYLIQAGTRDRPWWWRGVRSNRFVYVRYASGFEELYDLRADPAQLTNVASTPAYAAVRGRFAARLDELVACSGRSCWTPRTTPGEH